jgi:glycosyltransferase involved in cell wall biosynthesis
MKNNLRIVLIGPVFPFRGGIAQHTTLLKRALEKETSVRTVSFKRLYPKWLYPGSSDKERDSAGAVETGAHYLIDSLNPLSWLAAARFCLDFKPDAVLIPWWTIYWTFCFRYLARPPDRPEQLAAALSGIDRQRMDAMAAGIAAYKKRFSWEGLVAAILKMSGKASTEGALGDSCEPG